MFYQKKINLLKLFLNRIIVKYWSTDINVGMLLKIDGSHNGYYWLNTVNYSGKDEESLSITFKESIGQAIQ